MARGSSYEADAAAMAKRIEQARSAGEQLVLLPEMETGADGCDGTAAAVRGKGRASSVLREWLAQRGMKMPEDQLVELAGLNTRDDVFAAAMVRAEQIVAWQFDGAMRVLPSGTEVHARPTAAARLEAFKLVFTAMIRASEALAPYGMAKVTPDVSLTQSTTIVMAGGTGADRQPGQGARVVSGRRTAPPPMPGETVEHQGDADGDDA